MLRKLLSRFVSCIRLREPIYKVHPSRTRVLVSLTITNAAKAKEMLDSNHR
jgi:hypothetical protein